MGQVRKHKRVLKEIEQNCPFKKAFLTSLTRLSITAGYCVKISKNKPGTTTPKFNFMVAELVKAGLLWRTEKCDTIIRTVSLILCRNMYNTGNMLN